MGRYFINRWRYNRDTDSQHMQTLRQDLQPQRRFSTLPWLFIRYPKRKEDLTSASLREGGGFCKAKDGGSPRSRRKPNKALHTLTPSTTPWSPSLAEGGTKEESRNIRIFSLYTCSHFFFCRYIHFRAIYSRKMNSICFRYAQARYIVATCQFDMR